MIKFSQLVILFSLAFFLWACAGNSAPVNNAETNATPKPVTAPPPANRQSEASQGRGLYLSSCAACHKENGTGGKMTFEGRSIRPDDLTSPKIKARTDDKIIGAIYNGFEDEGMPAFKDKLSEAEIRAIVSYIRNDLQKDKTLPSL